MFSMFSVSCSLEVRELGRMTSPTPPEGSLGLFVLAADILQKAVGIYELAGWRRTKKSGGALSPSTESFIQSPESIYLLESSVFDMIPI